MKTNCHFFQVPTFARGASLLALFWSVAGMAAPPAYRLTPLGILPGYSESQAVAVNNSGQVTGNLTDSNGHPNAFIYSGGTMTALGVAGGFAWASAEAINNGGEIVGYAELAGGGSSAFSWQNGTMSSLDSHFSFAVAVNDTGVVVGGGTTLVTPYINEDAIIFPTTDLGRLSGYNLGSSADAVNNSGQILVEEDFESDAFESGGAELYLYSNGAYQDLGIVGDQSDSIKVFYMNNSGQIVGTLASNQHPFLYANGKVTDLGTAVGTGSTVDGINDSGQIVGTLGSDAFVYISGTRYLLSNLSISGGSGWRFIAATGINNSGQIVGTGFSPEPNSVEEAFLLTPLSSTYTITVSASPGAGGTESGGGTFAAGSSRTVTATANVGYAFTNWTENGTAVSTSASYTFTLNDNRNLVANFIDTNIPTWVEASVPYNSWYAAACSANGLEIVAVAGGPGNNGPIEISPDAGVTWTQTSAPIESWFSVACSADGSNIVAVAQEDAQGNAGQIYISTNAGATWALTSAPRGSWYSVASSADGTKLVALEDAGIYISTNSGATWISSGSGGDWDYSVASSTDGTKLVAVNDGAGNKYRVYTSTNAGVTWAPSGAPNGAPFSPWISVASSADGTKLVAGMDNGGVYISSDAGATWALASLPTNANWVGLASSADGSKLEALFGGSTTLGNFLIYSSIDGGLTWVNDNAAPGLTPLWTGIASSADGTRLVAAAENGSIWVSEPPLPPEGSLQVTIAPAGAVNAGAQWQVDSGTFQNSDVTITNLPAGSHTVSFNTISGWTTPANQIVLVSSNSTATVSGTYVQQFGAVRVTIGPAPVIAAGAKWQVDGGTLQKSGATVANLPLGNHTVSFHPINGWTTPSDQIVLISASSTTAASGTYVQQFGSLDVTINPAGAVTAGAQWQVDGGTLQSSGATLANLAVGNHKLSFNTVSGWVTPASQTVSISNNSTSAATGTYVQLFGALEVTISPAAAISGGAQWQVDYGAWENSGATVAGLPLGEHTVSFNGIDYWTAPSNQTVLIKANVTTKITKAYTFNAPGIYNGIFAQGITNVESSGLLSGLTVTASGTYSGKILIGQSTNAVSGSFNSSGQATNAVNRAVKQGGPLTLAMWVNWNNAPPNISGAVSGTNGGGWTADLTASLASNSLGSAEYTLLVPPSGTPPGSGYVLITNHAGVVTLSGALADGTAFNQSVRVSAEGDLPVYGNLYSGTGLLLGWISLESGLPAGTLTWIKEASGVGAFYTNGFTNVVVVQGSPWTNPLPHTAAIDLLSGQLDLSGGSMLAPLTFNVAVSTNDALVKLEGSPTNTLTGSINPKTGLLTITFGNGAGKATTAGKVAVLQNATNGAGFFLGKTNTGAILLQP